MSDFKLTAFTIGHSTRDIDDFIAILRAHGIKPIVDIRSVADALIVRGITVMDIFSRSSAKPERLNCMALAHGTEINYPLQKLAS